MAQDPTTNGGGVSSSPFASRDYRRWFAAETFLTVSMSTQLAVSLVLIDLWGSVSVIGMLSSAVSEVSTIIGEDPRNRRGPRQSAIGQTYRQPWLADRRWRL